MSFIKFKDYHRWTPRAPIKDLHGHLEQLQRERSILQTLYKINLVQCLQNRFLTMGLFEMTEQSLS